MVPFALAASFAADSVMATRLAVVIAPNVALDSVAAIHRVRGTCQAIAGPFAVRVAPEHGLPGGLFRRRVERREPLARHAFELVASLWASSVTSWAASRALEIAT